MWTCGWEVSGKSFRKHLGIIYLHNAQLKKQMHEGKQGFNMREERLISATQKPQTQMNWGSL